MSCCSSGLSFENAASQSCWLGASSHGLEFSSEEHPVIAMDNKTIRQQAFIASLNFQGFSERFRV
jgi:hypothetical protein